MPVPVFWRLPDWTGVILPTSSFSPCWQDKVNAVSVSELHDALSLSSVNEDRKLFLLAAQLDPDEARRNSLRGLDTFQDLLLQLIWSSCYSSFSSSSSCSYGQGGCGGKQADLQSLCSFCLRSWRMMTSCTSSVRSNSLSNDVSSPPFRNSSSLQFGSSHDLVLFLVVHTGKEDEENEGLLVAQCHRWVRTFKLSQLCSSGRRSKESMSMSKYSVLCCNEIVCSLLSNSCTFKNVYVKFI